MGIGGPGVLPEDAMPGLRSDFQANGADFGTSPGDAAAAPGLAPTLTMGQTMTAEMDAVMPSDDMAMAPAGWVMKALFRDWGDTAGDGDGGYETGAIVVKNLGEGTEHPFDADLSGRYVNVGSMFALTLTASGSEGTTSVDINSDTGAANTATATQWAAMVFDSDSLVAAQSQDPNIDQNETFKGMYFGAPGEFQCIEADAANPGCGLARNADGDVMVIDTAAATDGIQGGGRWTFTPDEGAMILVPDQDWMAYGAWLTTPDNPSGGADAHRLGVFFNGMDAWTPATNAVDATNDAGLHGSATYSGGATGIYVDGGESGLFTARAMLTANFDADMDGVNDEGTDYTISGRIDNFRGTNGMALGADTGDMPNPQGRGENDWVVELGTADFDTSGSEGTMAATATSGSADGVSWSGMWNGQMFGPSSDADGDPAGPSGVAGRFWAKTADPDIADADMNPVTAVVGAFGATRDD